MEHLSTARAAAALGLPEGTVRRMMRTGELPGAVRTGGTTGSWSVPRDTVELVAALRDGVPVDARELTGLDSTAAPHGPLVHAGLQLLGQRTTTTTGPADYVKPRAAVESTRRTVESLTTVHNRASKALTGLSWELLSVATDPGLPDDLRDQLLRALEQCADTVDPVSER